MWRAQKHALEKVMGDPNEAYSKLRMYPNKLEQRFPGLYTCIEIDDDGHFIYAFMSSASIHGPKDYKTIVVD